MRIYNNFRDRFKLDKVEFILNNTLVLKILYTSRITLYAMASNKLTKSEAFISGTSKMSAIFLGVIIFCGLVFVMEPKPVAAAKMSPQMRAYRKNMQQKRKRAEESPQEKAERQATQRARAEANKESNNKRRRLTRSKDTSDESNETRRMSNRVRMQQERDKSRRRKI